MLLGKINNELMLIAFPYVLYIASLRTDFFREITKLAFVACVKPSYMEKILRICKQELENVLHKK